MMKKVTWGELKRKIDEQVKDEDAVNHIVLVSDLINGIELDDIEIWDSLYGKVMQNSKKYTR
jgi:hypothetical protein